MSTALIYHDHFIDHDTGRGHPERPDRLRAIVVALRETGLWERVTHLPFEPAERKWIETLHTPDYIDRCFAVCAAGHGFIDTPDSCVCPASAGIAQLAVGGALSAVDAVMSGQASNAFCAVRPPGHHAEANLSMGFCLFNNVALAGQYLVEQHHVQRIAIVDFDVHHGNGTQHLFEDRADILFISIHENPRYLYPGTGFANETGRGAGAGYTLNVPLDPHGGDAEYQAAFSDLVLPRLREHQPQCLLVSAGFDAAAADPLAHMELTTTGFRWMAHELANIAGQHCDGRMIVMLEGGYDLTALSQGVCAVMDELLAAGE